MYWCIIYHHSNRRKPIHTDLKTLLLLEKNSNLSISERVITAISYDHKKLARKTTMYYFLSRLETRIEKLNSGGRKCQGNYRTENILHGFCKKCKLLFKDHLLGQNKGSGGKLRDLETHR
ncbi:hypothetical protein CEXT_678801 [Caerostris extrusa]|uniref:Uncharacterized protein n=1 Tax=Caerostris extrusa TaxID=172846 RepID=A0AAV4RZF0_CAEEX|nr:hypothetical protein CEXT_678801 [Caerostris extrusa]